MTGKYRDQKRLTARDISSGCAYFPECFREPCAGMGCKREVCNFFIEVCKRLCDIEEAREAAERSKMELTGKERG